MKLRIILGIVLALVAFAGGIAGMYFAMPYLAPERVEATRLHLDSLARADTSSPHALAGDSTASAADSLVALADTAALEQPGIEVLQDSLAALQSLLAQRETERAELRERVQDLQKAMKQIEARKEQTVELANTLAKLEDRELEEILAKLTTSVLERLYFEATGRNRQRLLQTMPAARAASFVGRLVSDDAEPASLSSTDASTDASDASTPETGGTN